MSLVLALALSASATNKNVRTSKIVGKEVVAPPLTPKFEVKPAIITQPVVKVVTAPVRPPVAVDNTDAKMFIYMHESGNNPYAVNKSSGACGLAQALPCSKMACALGDYACQDAWATNYMLNRYGTWENAKAFWLAHSWW